MNNVQAIIGVIAVCLIITCGSLAYGYMQNDESVINSDPIPDVKPTITPKPSTGTTQGETTMAASGTCGDNLTWSLDDQNTMIISGTGPMYDYGSNPPWNTYATSIWYVTISDGVTTIGNNAFTGCSYLRSAIIPDSVTSIGNYAFYHCSSLSTTYPSTLPGWSVTSIGKHAFDGCTSLRDVFIPNSVITIGDYAYKGCTQLTIATIGNSVTTIGHSAFYGCTNLKSITIPDSVTSIGDYAFYQCTFLASATIGRSVTSIGKAAFDSCTSLASVTIGSSVTSIGDYAFYGCTNLKTVYNQSSSLTLVKGSSGNGYVAKNATTLVQGNATVILVRAESDQTQGTFDTLSVKPGETKILDYSYTTQQVSGTNKVTVITHTATGWAEQ